MSVYVIGRAPVPCGACQSTGEQTPSAHLTQTFPSVTVTDPSGDAETLAFASSPPFDLKSE